MPFKLLLLSLLWCSLWAGSLYGQDTQPMVLGEDFSHTYLDQILEGYRDTSHMVSIGEMVSGTHSAYHSKIVSPGNLINIGYNRDTWWLHWQLENESAQNHALILSLGSSIINEATLFTVYDSAGQTIIDSLPTIGINYPYRQEYFTVRGWTYPITLQAGQQKHYWLRLHNDLASLRIIPELWDKPAYDNRITFFNLGWGIFFGILILTIIGAIAVFIATRQPVFLYYIFYISTLILLNGISLGLHIIIWKLDDPYLTHTFVFLTSVVVIVSMLLFSSAYLELKQWAPKLYRITYITIGVFLLFTVLWFAWPHHLSISKWLVHLFTGLPLLSLIVILIAVFLQKPIPPQHKLYLVAFSPLVILSLGIALRNNGVMGHSILFDIRMPISFAFEAIVFSYALALRIRDMRNEREALLQQINVQQRDSFRAVIEATEKERKRVAEDLHDGLGQLLSTAKLNLTAIELPQTTEEHNSIETSLSLLDEACQEVRHISHNMMPGTLIRLGLVSAVKEQARKINESGKVLVSIHVAGFEERMDETREIAMYRVIQELLNNSIRYSNATDIEIKLEQLADGYLFRIKDNGKGFDPKVLEQNKGIGWRNIRSRVDLLHGNIDLKTAPGKGTVLNIWVP
ncbi:hypothetical protein BH09BAC1_BH09BAC1_00320 [soil metagenome]